MIKDAIGNELQIGDTVHAEAANGTWIVGIIQKMQDGGISLFSSMPNKNGQTPTTPDILVLNCAVVLAGNAGIPHPNVIKIAAKNVVDQVIDKSVTQ